MLIRVELIKYMQENLAKSTADAIKQFTEPKRKKIKKDDKEKETEKVGERVESGMFHPGLKEELLEQLELIEAIKEKKVDISFKVLIDMACLTVSLILVWKQKKGIGCPKRI
jgi:hypothetical protein